MKNQIEKNKPLKNIGRKPELLVLDASYTLEMLVERGMMHSVLCRDLDGFFFHVWSVHPFASLLSSEKSATRFGDCVYHSLTPRHTFIEGKVGRFNFLSRYPRINFFVAQFSLFISLLFLIWRRPIRIIRVGDPLYLGIFGLVLSALTRSRLVIRVNGNNVRLRKDTGNAVYPKLFGSSGCEERIENFVLPRADLVAAPNHDNAEFATACGALSGRVTIFPYGNLLAPEHFSEPTTCVCDIDMFRDLGIEPRKYLLLVGRLEPLKFPDDVVRAFAEIRQRGIDVKLVLAGNGNMLSELKILSYTMNVQDHIIFAGNQNQRSLRQLYTFASTVISPLTGRALSEAALCACPIVAYDLDWQGELITNGETGALVPFRSWQTIANEVEQFLLKPDLAAKMGQNARLRALSMFDPVLLNEHERGQYIKLL